MKRLFLILFVAAAFAACGDGYNEGTNSYSTGINAPRNESQPDTSNMNDTTSYDRATTPRDSM